MKKIPLDKFTRLLEDALYASIISVFAQGYELIHSAAKEEKWDIDFAEVSRIWEGGCIIRARLLRVFHKEFGSNKKQYKHIFLLPGVQKIMKLNSNKLRKFVGDATGSGLALPGFASSLFYFESMVEKRMPSSFIQGLRDYFGAHTYERVDKPGNFHTDWD